MVVSPSAGRLLLAGAFMLSGAGGLIYEITWTRLLSLVFGSTALAVTTITTVFMAGLALGAIVAGPRADRSAHPARAYGLLELALAAYALAFPFILDVFEDTWYRMVPGAHLSLVVASILRFLAGCALLMLPTAFMGATLPFLARQYVRSTANLGTDLGRIYGVNTLGGVLGCWLAGTWLLPAFGVVVSTGVAVALSLAAAGVALAVSAGTPAEDAPTAPAPAQAAPVAPKVLLPLVFFSGLTFLAYEVQWVRLQRIFVPLTALESFTLILSACLLGLALGGLLYPLVERRVQGLQGVAKLQLLAGLLGFLPYALLSGISTVEPLGAALVGVVVLAVLTSVCYGLLFPLFNSLGTANLRVLGRTVGGVYAVLTLGNIAGSFLAGFLLIPTLGLEGGLVACALANLGIAAAAGLAGGRPWPLLAGPALGGVAVLGLSAWLPNHPFLNLAEGERLLWYNDGLTSSTAVIEGPEPGRRALMVESLYSRILPDVIRPELPILVGGAPERVLLVGFGSGVNSHRVMSIFPNTELTAVELDDNQVATASFFEGDNHNILERPGFTFVADDGRSYLHASDPVFDVIAMDAYLYYGHLDLYGLGFTELARDRLRPGGVYCQRLPIFNLQLKDFKALLATFVSVFPEASLWEVANNLYMLMGTTEPFALDGPAFRARVEAAKLEEPFTRVAARLVAGPEEVAKMAEGGEIITDLKPYRLISEEHPDEAQVFDPLFPSHGQAQAQEVSSLIAAHRAPVGKYFSGLSEGELQSIERARSSQRAAGPTMAPGPARPPGQPQGPANPPGPPNPQGPARPPGPAQR